MEPIIKINTAYFNSNPISRTHALPLVNEIIEKVKEIFLKVHGEIKWVWNTVSLTTDRCCQKVQHLFSRIVIVVKKHIGLQKEGVKVTPALQSEAVVAQRAIFIPPPQLLVERGQVAPEPVRPDELNGADPRPNLGIEANQIHQNQRMALRPLKLVRFINVLFPTLGQVLGSRDFLTGILEAAVTAHLQANTAQAALKETPVGEPPAVITAAEKRAQAAQTTLETVWAHINSRIRQASHTAFIAARRHAAQAVHVVGGQQMRAAEADRVLVEHRLALEAHHNNLTQRDEKVVKLQQG